MTEQTPDPTASQLPPQIHIHNTAQAGATAGSARGTRHGLHLLLTILTGGLWAPIWIWRAITNRRRDGVTFNNR